MICYIGYIKVSGVVMENKEQLMRDISAIYKFIYENKQIHRNTLKKKLLQSKIPSQKRFAAAFEVLAKEGKIKLDKECVSVNEANISVGVLQLCDDEYYVVLSNSSKKQKISKSVAAGYHVGDVLDVIVDKKNNSATILGKSKKHISQTAKHTSKVSKPMAEDMVLGRVVKLSHNELVFIPNKKSLPVRQIPILNSAEEQSAFQDKICIMKLEQADAPILGGTIVDVKGDAGNPIHEYDAIAESYGAIMSWEGERIQAEIDQIPTKVDVNSLPLITEEQAKTNQRNNVVDLRHLPFVTIDPATCKDMDDAIYSTINENGDIVCYTAVANVTKYFSLYSEIGKRYLNGAFTIYAPNKAYNILPTKLSTGVCSLNPNEPRLALVVKSDRKSVV